LVIRSKKILRASSKRRWSALSYNTIARFSERSQFQDLLVRHIFQRRSGDRTVIQTGCAIRWRIWRDRYSQAAVGGALGAAIIRACPDRIGTHTTSLLHDCLQKS
jgi:hypothetical protein